MNVFKRAKILSWACLWVTATWLPKQASPADSSRPRIRDLGVKPGVLAVGPMNAITDVKGVLVGQRTLIKGQSIRTGVTAILPHSGNLFQNKVSAGVWVGNGYGKAAGFLQVRELGNLETPIILTNTLSVAAAVSAVVRWSLRQPGNQEVVSVNSVVGETNDSQLNDIRAMRVTEADVIAAIEAASSGRVREGSVGAGTGTYALGWKGGIGTSSRVLPASLGGYTLGALVQSNFGGILTIRGVPVGEILGRYSYRNQLEARPKSTQAGQTHASRADRGSCMIVLATDAPLSARNLERLANRGLLGMARTGSFMSNGSGDFVIAFSTHIQEPNPKVPSKQPAAVRVRNRDMSPLFLAAVEAVEEAIYNSLLGATTVSGHEQRTIEAIPIDRLREILGKYGKL